MTSNRTPRNDKLHVVSLPAGIGVERNVRVRMSDGVHLSVNIFRPVTHDPVPVLMTFSRYGKDAPAMEYLVAFSELRRAFGAGLGDCSMSVDTPWEGPDPAFWVPRGYAIVIADARGVPETGFTDWCRSKAYGNIPGSFDPPETVAEGTPIFAAYTAN